MAVGDTRGSRHLIQNSLRLPSPSPVAGTGRISDSSPLTDIIYLGGTATHYATVQKLLERLEIKKFVKRDRAPWPHLFESRIKREELLGRQLQTTADKLCNGSLALLLTGLAKSSLNRKDCRSLRRLLDEPDGDVH